MPHVDILQVVLLRLQHGEPLLRLAPFFGDRDALLAGQVLAGQGVGVVQDFLERALRGHLPAVYARAGADIHDVVGGAHGFLVVLDHDQGIAQVAQML